MSGSTFTVPRSSTAYQYRVDTLSSGGSTVWGPQKAPREPVTFVGPNGVSTLYLKELDVFGNVVGDPVALTGVAMATGAFEAQDPQLPAGIARDSEVAALLSALPGTFVLIDVAAATGVAATDRAAIQAGLDAVSAAGGGVALLRRGQTYTVNIAGTQTGYPAPTGTFGPSYCLKIPNNVVLDLNGSTLKLSAAQDAILAIHADLTTPHDLGIVNGTIDGNNVLLTNQFLIQWQGVTRPRLEKLRFQNGKHGFVQLVNIDHGYFDQLHADTMIGQPFAFGFPSADGSLAVRRSHFGYLSATNITAEDGATFPGNVFYGELQRCTMGTFRGWNSACGVKFGWSCQDVQVDKIELDTIGDAQGNTGVKIQGDATHHPQRVVIGKVIAKAQQAFGLWFEYCIDCTVGVYVGQGNQILATSSDVWIGGTRDTVGVIRSDSSGAQGVQFRNYADGADLGSVTITNPTGYAVAASMVSGVRHRIGVLTATDDRAGSALMTRGVQADGSGGVLEIGRRKVTGQTGLPINVSTGGARVSSPGGEKPKAVGVWYAAAPAGSSSTSTNLATNNALKVQPHVFERRTRITQLAVEVSTAGEAGSTFRPCIYADTGAGAVGPLIIEGSAVATDTTGWKACTAFDIILEPGVYYFGGVQQNASTTPATFRVATTPSLDLPMTADSTLPSTGGGTIAAFSKTGVTGACPSDFASTAVSGSSTARVIYLTAAI